MSRRWLREALAVVVIVCWLPLRRCTAAWGRGGGGGHASRGGAQTSVNRSAGASRNVSGNANRNVNRNANRNINSNVNRNVDATSTATSTNRNVNVNRDIDFDRDIDVDVDRVWRIRRRLLLSPGRAGRDGDRGRGDDGSGDWLDGVLAAVVVSGGQRQRVRRTSSADRRGTSRSSRDRAVNYIVVNPPQIAAAAY